MITRKKSTRRNLSRNPTNTVNIKPVPPFRLDLTVWVLRRGIENIVDRWDGRTYRRLLVVDNEPLEIVVTQTGESINPSLSVIVTCEHSAYSLKPAILEMAGLLLGAQIDLNDFYEFASHKAKLRSTIERFRGVKPPRFSTLYEALVNGITCQQITLNLGILLLNRLAVKYGVSKKTENGVIFAFPRPQDMVSLEPYALRPLGFSRQKSRAIIESANRIVDEGFDFKHFEGLSDSDCIRQLSEFRGVGRWTAEYVLLRGLGRFHIFPADDVGARNYLRRWLKVPQQLDYDSVNRILRQWKPYGGLIYFHMLLNRLTEEGVLS